MKNPAVEAEIARIRAEADKVAGVAVLTVAEKRMFLARVVRACVASTPESSDLWQSIKRADEGTEYRLPDKLRTIMLDNDLAGDGPEAKSRHALAEMPERVTSASEQPTRVTGGAGVN